MKKVSKSFSIFSEIGRDLIKVAEKYCNFSFNKTYNVIVGGRKYEFFVDTRTDIITVSKFEKRHEKVKI